MGYRMDLPDWYFDWATDLSMFQWKIWRYAGALRVVEEYSYNLY